LPGLFFAFNISIYKENSNFGLLIFTYMKNPLWNIVLIFAISMITFAIYSFYPQKVEVLSVKIRKVELKSIVNIQQQKAYIPQADNSEFMFTIRDSLRLNKKKDKPAVDSSIQRILVIGDSMLESIMHRLKDLAVHNNHFFKPVIWYSSSTKWYGSSDTIRYFINKYKPTYIMIILGANELFIRNIIERRQKYVHNILKQVENIEYIWIGPPNWTDDTGINELILKNVGPKQFFPSYKLKFERTDDGAHPTRSSASEWADSVASWVMKSSSNPILLDIPDTSYNKYPNPVILQPL
jgi:hypothetical protein